MSDKDQQRWRMMVKGMIEGGCNARAEAAGTQTERTSIGRVWAAEAVRRTSGAEKQRRSQKGERGRHGGKVHV